MSETPVKSTEVKKLEDLSERANALPYDSSYASYPMTSTDKAALGVFTAVITGIVGFAVWVGIKEDKRQAEETEKRNEEMKQKRAEREAWFDEQRNLGNLVVETREGVYIAIPAEVYAKAPTRKKGQ